MTCTVRVHCKSHETHTTFLPWSQKNIISNQSYQHKKISFNIITLWFAREPQAYTREKSVQRSTVKTTTSLENPPNHFPPFCGSTPVSLSACVFRSYSKPTKRPGKEGGRRADPSGRIRDGLSRSAIRAAWRHMRTVKKNRGPLNCILVLNLCQYS